MNRSLTIAGLMSILISSAAFAQVKQGHPLIPPYPGSTSGQAVNVVAFDEFDLPVGPTKGGKFTKLERVEGKVTHFGYGRPEGRSTLEVFRNYEAALKTAGFT